MAGKTVRTTITLPVETVNALNKHVSARKRSEFIAEAVEARLAALDFHQALDECAGAWTDENHPDLNAAEDVRRYVREMRAEKGLRGSSARKVAE
ncbi:MAG: ribbon-helix-helix domain-containing protein [Candidatus Poribacteria bacterium]|nr:ribbon-helix-helix domain-containing protein [Candidatus Poribacteria bacterium]